MGTRLSSLLPSVDRSAIGRHLLKYWLLSECCFYVLFRLRLRHLQPYTNAPPLLPNDSSRAIMHKVWLTFSVQQAGDGRGIKDFLTGWFYGCAFDQLKRGNVAEFLSWSLWSRFPHGLTDHENAELESIIRTMEKKGGFKLPLGKNPDLHCMRLSLDPCVAIHRPLIIYLFLYWSTCLANLWLWWRGFSRHELGTLRYWYKPAAPVVSLRPSLFDGCWKWLTSKLPSLPVLQTPSAPQIEPKPTSLAASLLPETIASFNSLPSMSDLSALSRLSRPIPARNSYWCGHDELDVHSAACQLRQHNEANTLATLSTYSLSDFCSGVPLPRSITDLASIDDDSEQFVELNDLESSASYARWPDHNDMGSELFGHETHDANAPFPSTRPIVSPVDLKSPRVESVAVAETSEEIPESHKPIIFLHGVGTGLAGYIPLLRPFLATCSHRPIFFVEAPYVAMRFWENIPTPFETAELIHAMLQQHAFEKAAFVGHSFGSISVAWVCKMRPKIVDSVFLIDPVSLLLNFPKVAFNFVYKTPRLLPGSIPVKQWLYEWLVAFCSTELAISSVMYRHFWWYLNSLWAQELPAKSTVVLSSHDSLVPSCRVRRHLELHAPHANIHWMQDLDHAQFLLHSPVNHRLAQLIELSTK